MPHTSQWDPCPWIALGRSDPSGPSLPPVVNKVLVQLLNVLAGDRVLFTHNRRYYNVLQGGMDVVVSFPKACDALLGTPGSLLDLFSPDKGTESPSSIISKKTLGPQQHHLSPGSAWKGRVSSRDSITCSTFRKALTNESSLTLVITRQLLGCIPVIFNFMGNLFSRTQTRLFNINCCRMSCGANFVHVNCPSDTITYAFLGSCRVLRRILVPLSKIDA